MIRLENLIKTESRHIEKVNEMRRNGEEPDEMRVKLLTNTRNEIEEIKNMSQLEREFEDAIVHQPPWDYPLIETLLEKGANPNKKIPGQAMNLLGLAAFWRDTTLLAILLMHGADPNPNPSYLHNPLDSFTYDGNLIGVRLLVEHGSRLNLSDGTNFINMAIRHSKDNKIEIVSYLISKGGKFDDSPGPRNTENLLIQYGIYEQVMRNIGATKMLGNWRKRAEEPYSRARYNTMMDQYDEMVDSSEGRQTLGDFARSRLSGRIKVDPEERKYLEKSLAMGEKIGPEYLRSPVSLSSPKKKKSPRRKSPRRKSPRRKSPRRKSPRRKSPRRKRTRMNTGGSPGRILPIRQSLSSRNQKKSKSLEERVSVSEPHLDKTIIDKSGETIRVYNLWVSDGRGLGLGGGGESLVYLAVKGNQVPGYIGGEIEETGELKPGQTLVISTTTDHPYPENSDLHDYSGSSIEIFDGEPDTFDESLFPSFPEGQRTRMQYDKVTYEEALELLEDTDGIVKIDL